MREIPKYNLEKERIQFIDFIVIIPYGIIIFNCLYNVLAKYISDRLL